MTPRLAFLGTDGASAPAPGGPTSVAIGNLDGAHRGHAALVRALVEPPVASAPRARPVALTFDPHPAAVLGRAAPPLLTSFPRRAALLGRLGVDATAVATFDRALAGLSAEAFVREVLGEGLGARRVVVGEDFRFGKGRAGDTALLEALGRELGFEVVVVPAVGDGQGAFSSSRVREALARGDVASARAVLGRPHAVTGVVVEGDRLGRTLGFPTANLGALEETPPAYGVYAVTVEALDGAARGPGVPLGRGVLNVGVRPTVTGTRLERCEVHLLEGGGDLYGRTLRVAFVARLREERRFDGLDALVAQIARDVDAARQALAGAAPGEGVVYDRDDGALAAPAVVRV